MLIGTFARQTATPCKGTTARHMSAQLASGLLQAVDGYLEMIATIFLVRASTISTWPFTSA